MRAVTDVGGVWASNRDFRAVARAYPLPRLCRVRRHFASILVFAIATAVPLLSADASGRKTFLTAWQNRTVVLRRPLYSIVYDERSRWVPLAKHDGRVAGLTVGTPSAMYYQFDARRDSEDDIIESDPNALVSRLRDQYRRSTALELGNVQDVEPVLLVRYEPGTALVVKKIQIERDRVRLLLHKDRDSDLATTLTVKWPAPLSKELTESAPIEGVLARFVTRR